MNFCYDDNWISIVYWLKLESCNLIREASMGCNSIKRWILLYRISISLRTLMLLYGSHVSFHIFPHTWNECQHIISSFWPFHSLFWKNPSMGIYFYGPLSTEALVSFCSSFDLVTLLSCHCPLHHLLSLLLLAPPHLSALILPSSSSCIN